MTAAATNDSVRPEKLSGIARSPALWLGATCFLVHLSANAHYDVFRDELYFIVCGLHPAFGYVDQPPLIPLIAAASYKLFGTALTPLRLVPALASAATVAPKRKTIPVGLGPDHVGDPHQGLRGGLAGDGVDGQRNPIDASAPGASDSLRITAQDWGSDVKLSPNATTLAPFRRGRRSTIDATAGSPSKASAASAASFRMRPSSAA